MKTILIGRNELPAMVDDDFIHPEGWSLSLSESGHVRMMRSTGQRRPKGSYIYEQDYLGRWITECPEGMTVLYRDRDKLNLQRENLLIVERGVNIRAQGGQKGDFKGVHFSKTKNKWIAQITHNYQTQTLGSFDDEHHATTSSAAQAGQVGSGSGRSGPMISDM